MVRFGIVGVNRSAERFARAGSLHPEFCLGAVCSRLSEAADKFASRHGVGRVFTSTEEMACSGDIDAVYIASANAFHKIHCLKFLRHRIPVLIEAPLACTRKDAEEMIRIAGQQETLLMHGMHHTLLPQYHALREQLPRIGEVRQILAGYCQRHPAYDNYSKGIMEHAFRAELRVGAMLDLGIRLVLPLVDLFGPPLEVRADALRLSAGVDGCGTLIARYPDMLASLSFSKITGARLNAEILGENGALLTSTLNDAPSVQVLLRGMEPQSIPFQQIQYGVYYEIDEFISLINHGKTESRINNHRNDLQAMEIIDEYHRQAGIALELQNCGASNLGGTPTSMWG